MEPYLIEGNHVLTFNWGGVNAGDVVVFRVSGDFFVKRVTKVAGKNMVVEGDNEAMSSKMHPMKAEQVVGKVVLKY